MRQIFRVFFNQEDKACSYLIQAAQEFPASGYLFDVTLGMYASAPHLFFHSLGHRCGEFEYNNTRAMATFEYSSITPISGLLFFCYDNRTNWSDLY